MEIFEKDGKINFVDENNVVVGFDYGQSCCEYFGYFFSSGIPTKDFMAEYVNLSYNTPNIMPHPETNEYVFDPDFFQRIDWGGNETTIVIFKLVEKCRLTNGKVNKGLCRFRDIYLVLHNTHNGYYAHGFNMNVGGIDVRMGDL